MVEAMLGWPLAFWMLPSFMWHMARLEKCTTFSSLICAIVSGLTYSAQSRPVGVCESGICGIICGLTGLVV